MKKLLLLLSLIGPIQYASAMESALKVRTGQLNRQLFATIKSRARVEDICTLIEKGADINATDVCGTTALICAARNGLSEVCRALTEKGADINAINIYGFTSLIWAAITDHSEVVKAILSNAIILPPVNSNPDVSRKVLYILLDLFKEKGIPKDIQWEIFQQIEESEGGKLSPIFIHLARRRNPLPPRLMNIVVAKIASYTMEHLKPMMVKARAEATSDELKNLLNPESLESEFGDQIHNNIRKALKQENIVSKSSSIRLWGHRIMNFIKLEDNVMKLTFALLVITGFLRFFF